MAQVRLGRYEVEQNTLPRLCMCCGEPAVIAKTKKFAWHPPWVIALIPAGVLVYIIVAVILTKRMTVQAPLCTNHKNHWFNRNVLVYGWLMFVLFVPAGLIILTSSTNSMSAEHIRLVAREFAVWSMSLFSWIIIVFVARLTAIRPKEITDHSITLTMVSPRFIEALNKERSRSESEWEDEYPPRPRTRTDADDRVYDPRRRPDRPSTDAFWNRES